MGLGLGLGLGFGVGVWSLGLGLGFQLACELGDSIAPCRILSTAERRLEQQRHTEGVVAGPPLGSRLLGTPALVPLP